MTDSGKIDSAEAFRTPPPEELLARSLIAAVGGGGITALALAERGALWPVAAWSIALGALAWIGRGLWRGGVSRAVVFVVALVWFGPGYDALLYGSDATIYYAQGAHIARTGQLWVDDPLLAGLPHRTEAEFFPSHGLVWGAARSRSPAGLVFEPLSTRVYSAFSQLPSVLLSFGWLLAGSDGAVWVTPLLAAGAVSAFFGLLARHLGPVRAAAAAVFLTLSLPQTFFARLPMAEAVGQFFLWNGLLALDVTRARRNLDRTASLLAGLGLGGAALARPEYLVLLPLGMVALWVAHGGWRPPAEVWAAVTALVAYGAALLFLLVPTHYREPVRNVWIQLTFWIRGVDPTTLWLTAAATAACLVGLVVMVGIVVRRAGVAAGVRVGVLVGCVAWFAAYLSRGALSADAQGLSWMPWGIAVPILVLGAAGAPLLVRRLWQSDGGALALTLCLIAWLHFLPASHTMVGAPLWAARRLLPVALPGLFAAVACACFWDGLPRAVRVLAAGAVACALAWTSQPLWTTDFYEGASEATAEVAALMDEGSVVLVDSSLKDSLLDAALILAHGRMAVASRRLAGDRSLADKLSAPGSARSLTFLWPTAMVVPAGAGRIASSEAEIRYPGSAARTQLSVTAFRPPRPVEPAM